MDFPEVLKRNPRPVPAWAPGVVFAIFILILCDVLALVIGGFPLLEGMSQMNLASTRPVWASVVESKVLRDSEGKQTGSVKVQWRDARGQTHVDTVSVAPGWAASFRPGQQKELFAATSTFGTRHTALRESLRDATTFGRNTMYLGLGIMGLLFLAGIGNFIVILRKRALLRTGKPAIARVTDAYWKRQTSSERRRGQHSRPTYIVRYEVTTQDGQRFTGKESFSAPMLAKIGHISTGEQIYVVHSGKRSCIWGPRHPVLSTG